MRFGLSRLFTAPQARSLPPADMLTVVSGYHAHRREAESVCSGAGAFERWGSAAQLEGARKMRARKESAQARDDVLRGRLRLRGYAAQ